MDNVIGYKRLCYYHVTYELQSERTLYSFPNVKELFARAGAISEL